MDQLGTIGGTLGLFTGMSLLSMIEIVFFLYAFLKTLLKIETMDLKTAVQSTILAIGKKEGRRYDDEIGNQETDEFMSDCSSNELQAKVKQLEEKFKNLEKKHDEKIQQHDNEINDLKQLLLLFLPSDKKQMVQEHFDKRESSTPTKNSTNDDFSSHIENRTIQDDIDKDDVSYLLNYSLDLKAS